MEYFCRQPKLYNEFYCTGSDCPDNCCHGWGHILWKNDEYSKLCNSDCSVSIRNLIDNAFVRKDKNFLQIKGTDNGECEECPFLTENKLCMIQAELGAEYLSSVCRIYPRIFYNRNKFILRTCNTSCHRVMEILLNNKKCMEFSDSIEQINDIGNIMGGHIDLNNAIMKYPLIGYRTELYNFFYDIISNEDYSVETALVLGALAARQISKFEANKQYDKIPKVLEALKDQLNNPEQIKKIEAIAPNYTLKFNFVNRVLGYIYDSKIGLVTLYNENGRPSKEKYETGAENISKAFADRPFAFRNIILNILTEYFIHIYSPKNNAYENFSYLVACFACIKFIAVSDYFSETDNDEKFILDCTHFSRKLCHSKETVEKVLLFLKEHNCTSPAHLALLIK